MLLDSANALSVLYVCLSVCLSVSLCLSVCLSVSLSLSLSLCLSVCLSVGLSLFLSLSLSQRFSDIFKLNPSELIVSTMHHSTTITMCRLYKHTCWNKNTDVFDHLSFFKNKHKTFVFSKYCS